MKKFKCSICNKPIDTSDWTRSYNQRLQKAREQGQNWDCYMPSIAMHTHIPCLLKSR